LFNMPVPGTPRNRSVTRRAGGAMWSGTGVRMGRF
jgi:hypothetical protein